MSAGGNDERTQPFFDPARVEAFRETYGSDPRTWFAQDRPAATLADALEELELFGLPALCARCGRAYRPAAPAADRCAVCAPNDPPGAPPSAPPARGPVHSPSAGAPRRRESPP